MASTSVVEATAGGGGPGPGAAGNIALMASLTPEQVREIREYDKLLRLRDQVVGGSHPRIKPAHQLGRAAQSSNPPSAPPASATSAAPAPGTQSAAAKSAGSGDRPVIDNFHSHQANQQRAQVNVSSSLPGLGPPPGAPNGPRQFGSGKPEINPVLLEKSDDLIKAEIQLQRQRLERGLKEQLEQRRAAHKASEQLAELDVADIMAKALSLVHATPAARSTDDTAANVSASSDSFDDNNTFYSSRHDTPESNMVSRLPNESEDEEMREGSPYEPELDMESISAPAAPPAPSAPPAASAAPANHAQTAAFPPQAIPGVAPPRQQPAAPASEAPTSSVTVPGLSIGVAGSTRAYNPPQPPEAAGALQKGSGSRSGDSSEAGNGQSSNAQGLARVSEQLRSQALARAPSPRIYSHDLSPLAPQPTHALPPAITRQPDAAAVESAVNPQAAPAAITALRKQPSHGSSPESSPQGSKAAEKKKNKKKKRKADRIATETAAASPYIKPEPRSPSPLTSQYARPHKRQRQSQQQHAEAHEEEPRYEQPLPAEEGYQERYQTRVVRQERVVGYERADDYRPHGDEPVLVTSPRYERVYYDDYRAPPPSGYAPGPESAHYVSREVRTIRHAPRVVEGPYEDGGATYYRDVRAASRMSMRPPAYPDRSQSPVLYERPSAAMPPPKAPPRRVVVDAFGREYLEPARPATVMREEVAPEPRAPYDRALPPRAVSRRPEPFEEDAVLYRPASPAYTVPRRVITQPEYGYREGGAPGHPVAPPPPSDYVPARAEPPREYIPRAPSVRPPPPPMEPTRYGSVPRYERLPAAAEERPPPHQDYFRAASVRPVDGVTTRYEVPVAYERRLGPDEQPVPVREYPPPPPPPPPMRPASVRPAETVRYGMPGDYGARNLAPGERMEYAAAPPAAYPDARREPMQPPPPPPPRAYSVMPGEVPVVRREYGAPSQAAERYYARPAGREDEEVVFLDRPHRDAYREMR